MESCQEGWKSLKKVFEGWQKINAGGRNFMSFICKCWNKCIHIQVFQVKRWVLWIASSKIYVNLSQLKLPQQRNYNKRSTITRREFQTTAHRRIFYIFGKHLLTDLNVHKFGVIEEKTRKLLFIFNLQLTLLMIYQGRGINRSWLPRI